jgi:hypothetical protein
MSPMPAPLLNVDVHSKLTTVRNTFIHFVEEYSTPSGCHSGCGTPQPHVRRSMTAPAHAEGYCPAEAEESPMECRVERLATFDEFDADLSSPTRSPLRSVGIADACKGYPVGAMVVADEQGFYYEVPMSGNMSFVVPFQFNGNFIVGYDAAAGNVIPAAPCCGFQMSQIQEFQGAMYGVPCSTASTVYGHHDPPAAQHDGPVTRMSSTDSSVEGLAVAPQPAEAAWKAGGGRGAGRSARRLENTTVMLKNLPNNYTRAMLLDLIDAAGFQCRYDFLYLPIDFRTHAALGYAFVNFLAESDAEKFHRHMDGFCRWALPSNKVCYVGWSQPHQGLDSNVQRYRNSPLMHPAVPDEYRPVIFLAGTRVPFPPPTKKVKPPRQGTERMLV